jgi:hypothetical protein
MFTRKPRLQLEKFAINGAKRLLQHNLPGGDIAPCFKVAGHDSGILNTLKLGFSPGVAERTLEQDGEAGKRVPTT